MLRGLKSVIVAAGVGAVATLAVPATAAFATTTATPCPDSRWADIITSLNFHHCYKNSGSLSVTINDSKVFKSGNYTVRFDFNDGTHLSLAPHVTWPPFSPTKTTIKVTIA